VSSVTVVLPVDYMLSLSEATDAFPPSVRAEYVAKVSSPDTIHAVCEKYRAGAILDIRYDEEDHGTRWIACPTLVL
jgi:haloacetate dehalogenase